MTRPAQMVGFTLIEVLIVVVIIGILAGIVIPRIDSWVEQAQAASIQTNLQQMRTQISIYEQDHSALPTLADFTDQMTLASNAAGVTQPPDTPGFPYGPYLKRIPSNPNTNTNTISAGAVGTSAWYYDETTGEFLANDSAETRAY